MFEHLFKNKDGTDKRPFTIVHEDEFQRIVEQNAREEENWEPKEPEPGGEVTEHPSVAEEARIAAEDAQAALEGRKLDFGNNPCGNLRVDLHAIDATPARWRDDAGSSPFDGASTAASSPRNDFVKNDRVHRHRLISTQSANVVVEQHAVVGVGHQDLDQEPKVREEPRDLAVAQPPLAPEAKRVVVPDHVR